MYVLVQNNYDRGSVDLLLDGTDVVLIFIHFFRSCTNWKINLYCIQKLIHLYCVKSGYRGRVEMYIDCYTGNTYYYKPQITV